MKILRSATTVFWLRVTIPVNQELKVKEIVNPRMTFKVNGKAVELQPNDGQSSTFPSEAYFAVEPLIPGDKLEFHAEPFEPISAQTVIPQEIKDLYRYNLWGNYLGTWLILLLVVI